MSYKIKRKIIFSILISVAVIATSCNKKTIDENDIKKPTITNPNDDTKKTEPTIPIDNPKNSDEKKPIATPSEPPPGMTPTPDPGVGKDPVTESIDPSKLNNTTKGWGFKPNETHLVPEIPASTKKLIEKFSGYYIGDKSQKVIYLTFDEGYENGYSGQILDILKANNVKAAFFVTRPYIIKEKDLVKRMVDEGHLVCNHSSKHPSMPSVTHDTKLFNSEFTDTETAFKEVTGKDMPKFFRPPKGEYSELSLYLTKELGYKTIFWSFAHRDWEVNNQPSVEETLKRVLGRSHNGEIMLLHAVSKSNTDALDTILKTLKSEGYRFGTLEELK